MPNQIVKLNLGRVITYVDRLGVASIGKNDLLIGRVGRTPIGIARNGRNNAGQTLKIRLDAPKAASGKINVPQLMLIGRCLFYMSVGARAQLGLWIVEQSQYLLLAEATRDQAYKIPLLIQKDPTRIGTHAELANPLPAVIE